MKSSAKKTEIELRFERLAKFEEQGVQAYSPDFRRSSDLANVQKNYAEIGLEGIDCRLKVAGRLVKLRPCEKQIMVEIEDREGGLQLLLSAEFTMADNLRKFKEAILQGDWLGFFVNRLYRSEAGELTAQVYDWQLLAPSLLALPHPHEEEVCQAYLHLARDKDSRQDFVRQSKILRYLRRFLEDKYDFLEVKSPRPNRATNTKTALVRQGVSENYLKRMIIGGLEAVYEISEQAPDARLMAYLAPADLNMMMNLTEELFSALATALYGSQQLEWQSKSQRSPLALDFSQAWPRRTVYSLVQELTGVDFLRLDSIPAALAIAAKHGLDLVAESFTSVGGVAIYLLEKLVYPSLIQPSFIIDFPMEEYPLSKAHRHNPRLAECFEVIINGQTFANGFSELSDPRPQRSLEQYQASSENYLSQKAEPDYLNALKYGLPPTASLGIGLTPLLSLLSQASALRDLIVFPQAIQQKQAE